MIRATALGALVTGAGWLCLGLAFWLGSLALLGLGLGVLAWSLGARGRVAVGRPEVRFDVAAATEGVALPITITVSGVGGAVDATPRAIAGAALVRQDIRHEPGRVVIDQVVVPERSGMLMVPGPELYVGDPWGLHARRATATQVHRIAVKPATNWMGTGQRAGRRHTVQELVTGPRKLELQPEIEAIRPWRAGDKMRDIDWHRSTRGDMVSKERVRVDPRPVHVVLDATSRMRWHRRTAKLTTASRIAFGVMAAAIAAGVEGNLITVRDTGVATGKGTRGLSRAFDDLRRSDPPIPVDQVPRHVEGTGGGAPFLRSVGRFRPMGATSQAPMKEALAQALHRPGFVVLIMDGEEAPDEAIQAIKRVHRDAAGGLVMLASGAHHHRRDDSDVRERLAQWTQARRRVHSVAARLRFPVTVAMPGQEDEVIEEVAAWLA